MTTGTSRAPRALSFSTLSTSQCRPNPPLSPFGFLGISTQQGCSDLLSLSLALGHPFPSQPRFPGTLPPCDSSGGHKIAGSCHPGPPPPTLSSSDVCFPGGGRSADRSSRQGRGGTAHWGDLRALAREWRQGNHNSQNADGAHQHSPDTSESSACWDL